MSYSDAVNYILQVIVDVIVYGECKCVYVRVHVCVKSLFFFRTKV